ncbi:transcription antitermination factor NusB [Criblamydia sequanensis]|uniref:Transcription antitermination protein NusB n=1 Tax=Candidatus Criblamydia sequanensis CRIB-18 TaxID=1437425 RepID=A0A090CYU8_9BACT|nr:transcription antitermination factor NusB [Criblamydia sequanensis]CDR33932.1 N utilization substance protein B homolog [Criblamydia sequanensis CRIB-18]
MSLPHQKFREIVFQALFSLETDFNNEEELLKLIMEMLSVSKKSVREAFDRARLINQSKVSLDEAIGSTSRTFSFDRIQKVERNILRLCAYEILFDDTIPEKVAIAEGIRLARKFSTPESSLFVNAVLDAIYKKKLGVPTEGEGIEESLTKMNESFEPKEPEA